MFTVVCLIAWRFLLLAGDTELVLGLETYAQSFVCTANAEVFILDNKNIDRLIHKKNPHTIAMLRNTVDNKLRGRRNTQLGARVELYDHLSDKIEQSKRRFPGSALTFLKDEDEEEAKESKDAPTQSITDKVRDRDLMVSQLVKLFLQDKSPFIEPTVPGSLYYRTKSLDRAKKKRVEELREKDKGEKREKQATGELRLQRARKAARRPARSRRELEQLSIAQGSEEMRTLQDQSHAVNRILIKAEAPGPGRIYFPVEHTPRPSSSRSGRPMSAMSTSTLGGNERIFRLTEPHLPDDPDVDQVELTYDAMNSAVVKHIVCNMGELSQARNASRAQIVRSMIEKQTHQQSNSIQNLLRPTSAPVPRRHRSYCDDDGVEYGESFDRETSDGALSDLESRIRMFHEKHDAVDGSRSQVMQMPELRRFSIQVCIQHTGMYSAS